MSVCCQVASEGNRGELYLGGVDHRWPDGG